MASKINPFLHIHTGMCTHLNTHKHSHSHQHSHTGPVPEMTLFRNSVEEWVAPAVGLHRRLPAVPLTCCSFLLHACPLWASAETLGPWANMEPTIESDALKEVGPLVREVLRQNLCTKPWQPEPELCGGFNAQSSCVKRAAYALNTVYSSGQIEDFKAIIHLASLSLFFPLSKQTLSIFKRRSEKRTLNETWGKSQSGFNTEEI